jgi:hypothetical protein
VIIARVVAPMAGSGAIDIVRFAESTPSRGRLSPWLWLIPGLLALAAVGLFAAGKALPALPFVALTVISAVALSILSSRRSKSGLDAGGDHFGRAPYATAIFAANAAFIQDLSKVLEQLKDAARQEDWVLDWAKVNGLTTRAEESARKNDYVAAVREYCRAISVFMEQLRHQRRAK